MPPGAGITTVYRSGAALARLLPSVAAHWLPDLGAWPLSSLARRQRVMVARHMRRALGPAVDARAVRRAVRDAYGSYIRYWIESFRLPGTSVAALDEGIEVPDYHRVEAGLAAGKGVILALPHLGGWEWAGFWMAAHHGHRITVVVEPVSPPELFDWFAKFRSDLGMDVVPLGPDAGKAVLGALRRNEVVCLLSDRDIAGGGVPVQFFGETTTLPAGPAMLALRSGAALLPTAVYFRPAGHHLGVVRPPLDTARRGSIREDVARLTQDLADELAHLVGRAPSQWHMFQPNWPSDLQNL